MSGITHKLVRLIKGRKPYNCHKEYPEQYTRCYFFPRNICDGIDIIAKTHRITKKFAAQKIMEFGLSVYIGDNVSFMIHCDHGTLTPLELQVQQRMERELRHRARQKGIKLNKIFPKKPQS